MRRLRFDLLSRCRELKWGKRRMLLFHGDFIGRSDWWEKGQGHGIGFWDLEPRTECLMWFILFGSLTRFLEILRAEQGTTGHSVALKPIYRERETSMLFVYWRGHGRLQPRMIFHQTIRLSIWYMRRRNQERVMNVLSGSFDSRRYRRFSLLFWG